jgi:hypothetical protein
VWRTNNLGGSWSALSGDLAGGSDVMRSIAVAQGAPNTIYIATTSAMLGMTAVRGGQSQTTGYPQPRTALYKSENGGATWTLFWAPPLDPVLPANPNLPAGVVDTMFGVRLARLDPRNPKIVYATA